MLLSTGCGFADMVEETISGDTKEESLEGLIQTLKDLIAQVDIKIKDAGVNGSIMPVFSEISSSGP